MSAATKVNPLLAGQGGKNWNQLQDIPPPPGVAAAAPQAQPAPATAAPGQPRPGRLLPPVPPDKIPALLRAVTFMADMTGKLAAKKTTTVADVLVAAAHVLKQDFGDPKAMMTALASMPTEPAALHGWLLKEHQKHVQMAVELSAMQERAK
jgi:hypothetical protein